MKIFTSFLRQLLVVFSLLFVFSFSVFGEDCWFLVTDVSELKIGDKVIVVAKNGDYALSTTQNGNNRGQIGITKSGNFITFDNNAEVQVLTIESGKTSGTVAFNTGSGYLYAASSSKNYLRTEETLSANSSWSISVSLEGVATIKANGSNTRNLMRYNSTNNPPIFSCYSSGQDDICLYKLDEEQGGGTDSKLYTVTLYNGNAQYGEPLLGSSIELPVDVSIFNEKCEEEGWLFAGWSETQILENISEVDLVPNPYTPVSDCVLYAVYKLEEEFESEEIESWELTDIVSIKSDDEVVITMTNSSGTYAMSNDKGTSSAPVATEVTVSGNALSGDIADNIKWNISNSNGNLIIYPNGITAKWLYCTNTNNGVRVGDNANKVFTIDVTSGYLKHTGTSRFLGVYNSQDWRCYTNTTGNTANQTLDFFVKRVNVSSTIRTTYSSIPICEVYDIYFGDIKYQTDNNGSVIDIPDLPQSCNMLYSEPIGWTVDLKFGVNVEKPILVDKTTLFLQDTQLYPVYSNGVKNNDWGIVTDVSELATNDEIIIVYENKALGAQNDKYRSAVDLGVSGKDIINIGDATIISLVKHDGGNFSFQIPSEDNVYLVAPATDNNYLETNENIVNYAKWTISISDSVATITNAENTNRYLQYNPSSPRFTTYKESSNQQNVFIYKRKVTTDVLKYYICGDITIELGKIYSVAEDLSLNTLTIKSNLDEAGEIVLDEDVVLSVGNVVVEKTIDASRWFFFSLPFDCTIAGNIEAVDVAIGNTLEYLTNYSIFYYDQEVAANNKGATGSKAWMKITDANTTLKANRGYIIGYLVDEGEAKIKFKSGGTKEITAPENVEQLDLGEYTWYTEGEVATANGWNLIGLPYYQKMSGELTPNFVSIPNPDGKTYTQIEYSNANISPFTSFFIQVAKDKIPAFTIAAGGQNSAPMINQRLNQKYHQRAVVTLISADGGEDRTTIINNPNATTDYEIGQDLVKWIGYANIPQIYTIQGEDILAFNSLAIDNSTVIPLGVYVHSDGEYTFMLDEKSVGNVQDWMLYDNETGVTICLADNSYSIYLEKGTYEGRFELRMQQRVITNYDSATYDIVAWSGDRTFNIYNLPVNAEVYIYDAVGRIIDIIRPNSTSFSYDFSAHGVYNIVVRTADNHIVLKSIF